MVHKIRELCKNQNLSITELEKRAGVAHNTLSKWDKHEPNVYKVYRVAKVLGTTVEEILRTD